DRVGRLGDGWLGAGIGPAAAGVARRRIEASAAAAGRAIDPEHFGMSIPYARSEPDAETVAALLRRNPDAALEDIVPTGAAALRQLVVRLVDEGLSKFVLRPLDTVDDWDEALEWLAEATFHLQT